MFSRSFNKRSSLKMSELAFVLVPNVLSFGFLLNYTLNETTEKSTSNVKLTFSEFIEISSV